MSESVSPFLKHWITNILFLNLKHTFIFYKKLEKVPPYGRHFSSSCGGLRPSAAIVGPFGPNGVDLRWPIPKKISGNFFWEIFIQEVF